ncbi:MAG: alpha/beta hydrolase [Planctomycetota bacterium]|jgi:fermentation-respiration switch protein FrsA (DUF1100 family)
MSGDGRVPVSRDAAAPSPAKPRWRRALESAARVLIACAVLLFIMVRVLEGSFLYHPTRFPDGDWGAPERAGAECEDIFIDAPDGVRLHGWFLRADEAEGAAGDDTTAARVTILFLHGNAGNVSHRWSWMRGLSRLPADVFAIDYRGYGRSEGSPSEEGIYLDAGAAYRHLTETRGVPPERIVVYGRSLGGAPACHVASRFECGGLVLQSAFTSAPDMSGRVVPLVPLGWAMGTSFDGESMIARVEAPVLIIHSRADEVVPYEMGEGLFAAAKEPKAFVRLERSLHNDLAADEEARVFAKLGEFCRSVARGPE